MPTTTLGPIIITATQYSNCGQGGKQTLGTNPPATTFNTIGSELDVNSYSYAGNRLFEKAYLVFEVSGLPSDVTSADIVSAEINCRWRTLYSASKTQSFTVYGSDNPSPTKPSTAYQVLTNAATLGSPSQPLTINGTPTSKTLTVTNIVKTLVDNYNYTSTRDMLFFINAKFTTTTYTLFAFFSQDDFNGPALEIKYMVDPPPEPEAQSYKRGDQVLKRGNQVFKFI